MEVRGIKAFSRLDETQEAVKEGEGTLENLKLRYNVRWYNLDPYRCADDPQGLPAPVISHQTATTAGAGGQGCGCHRRSTWYADTHCEYFARHSRESQTS